MNEASGMTPRVKAAIEKIKSNCKDGQFISVEDLRDKYGISGATLTKYGLARTGYNSWDWERYRNILGKEAPLEEVVNIANNSEDNETYFAVKDGKVYYAKEEKGVILNLK